MWSHSFNQEVSFLPHRKSSFGGQVPLYHIHEGCMVIHGRSGTTVAPLGSKMGVALLLAGVATAATHAAWLSQQLRDRNKSLFFLSTISTFRSLCAYFSWRCPCLLKQRSDTNRQTSHIVSKQSIIQTVGGEVQKQGII